VNSSCSNVLPQLLPGNDGGEYSHGLLDLRFLRNVLLQFQGSNKTNTAPHPRNCILHSQHSENIKSYYFNFSWIFLLYIENHIYCIQSLRNISIFLLIKISSNFKVITGFVVKHLATHKEMSVSRVIPAKTHQAGTQCSTYGIQSCGVPKGKPICQLFWSVQVCRNRLKKFLLSTLNGVIEIQMNFRWFT
jgi:hypothetical protein